VSVNWLVIGIGDITRRRVIPAILEEPRSNLYGIVTRDPQKAAAYPQARVWTSLDDALQDDEVHAVYVASPVAFHAPHTNAALRAGKDVICEKPLGMNYPEARDMAATARECRRLFAAAYYRRLFPKLIRAKQLIAAGAIGQPVLAEGNCHSWLEIANREWLVDPAIAGGGPLFDTASHRIDALNFLFGRPVKAAGMRSNAVHRLAVEDSATVLIEYAGHTRAIVDVRWNSQIRRDQFRIIGAEGEINLDPFNSPTLRYPGGEEQLPPHDNFHFPLIEDFVKALLDGSDPACPGEEAIWTDWVTAAVK
jgi:1,5-anhydro-D-fructose reductase (1,5-anhydro-D-mannitol-forming)